MCDSLEYGKPSSFLTSGRNVQLAPQFVYSQDDAKALYIENGGTNLTEETCVGVDLLAAFPEKQLMRQAQFSSALQRIGSFGEIFGRTANHDWGAVTGGDPGICRYHRSPSLN